MNKYEEALKTLEELVEKTTSDKKAFQIPEGFYFQCPICYRKYYNKIPSQCYCGHINYGKVDEYGRRFI